MDAQLIDYLEALYEDDQRLMNVFSFRLKFPHLTQQLYAQVTERNLNQEIVQFLFDDDVDSEIERLVRTKTYKQLDKLNTVAILQGFDPLDAGDAW